MFFFFFSKRPCKRYKYGRNSLQLLASPPLLLFTGTGVDSLLHFCSGRLSHDTIEPSLTFCSAGMLKEPADQTPYFPPSSPSTVLASSSAAQFAKARCAVGRGGGGGGGGGVRDWSHKGVQ